MRGRLALVVVGSVLALGACASGGSADSAARGTGAPASADAPPSEPSPTSTVAPTNPPVAPVESTPRATPSSDVAVEAAFRQGIARTDAGWILSNDLTLFRVDDEFSIVAEDEQAIPADLVDQGFDHLGDIDVVDGVVYAPLEQGDYDAMHQKMVRYDASTLELVDLVDVAQSHNAWVSVDPDTHIAYSMSGFDDDRVLRYDVDDAWAPLDPILLERTLERVQGGDIARGYLWLSTDDPVNGTYRVDLATGAIADLGSAGPIDGEGEGIDATGTPTGDLHVLVADPAAVPMWVVHLVVG